MSDLSEVLLHELNSLDDLDSFEIEEDGELIDSLMLEKNHNNVFDDDFEDEDDEYEDDEDDYEDDEEDDD